MFSCFSLSDWVVSLAIGQQLDELIDGKRKADESMNNVLHWHQMKHCGSCIKERVLMMDLFGWFVAGSGNGPGAPRTTSDSGRSVVVRTTSAGDRWHPDARREDDPGPAESVYSADAQIFYR